VQFDGSAVAWVLASSALVLIMTPGIAFYYAGLTQAKHALSMLIQSFVVMGVVSLVWILVAYSLAFGKGNYLIGDLHFAGLLHMDEKVPGFDSDPMKIPQLVYVIFQMMFAVITPALITGATVGRWRFEAFVSFIVLWSVFVYAPIAHWVFSPTGFAWHILKDTHVLDFAGGTVVHANSGAAALAMALVLGPRRGDAKENMERHNMPLVMLGTTLLWFGWFGFNAGSALKPDLVAATAFLNTNSATAAALLTWVLVERISSGKATAFGAASGAVAGLIAITPCAGYIGPLEAIVVGIVAALVCTLAIRVKDQLHYDDALDVAGLHLAGGMIGSLCVGLFAALKVNRAEGADGLFHGGGFKQLIVQAIVVVAVVAYSFAVTYVIGRVLKFAFQGRDTVSEDQEKDGLDLSLHGESAYVGIYSSVTPADKDD